MFIEREAHRRIFQIYVILMLSLLIFLVSRWFLGFSSHLERLSAITLFYLTDFFILLLFVRFVDRTIFSEMGFTSKNLAKAIGLGFTASAGYIIMVPFFGIPPAFRIPEVLLLILTCFSVGLTEESFFRGYIQRKMKMVHDETSAVIYTAFLFSAAHIPSYVLGHDAGFLSVLTAVEALRSIAVLGALFGFLHEAVENIWCVVTAHATWDLYLMLFPPASLDYVQMLLFLALSSLSASGTLGLSIVLAVERRRAPLTVPLKMPPKKPWQETITLNYPTEIRSTTGREMSDFKFCPYCGGSLPQGCFYCPHCGKQIRAPAREKPSPIPPPPPPPPGALTAHLWPGLQRVKPLAERGDDELYERLLKIYVDFYGGRRVLDKKIESYIRSGLTRKEALVKLAMEEKLI